MGNPKHLKVTRKRTFIGNENRLAEVLKRVPNFPSIKSCGQRKFKRINKDEEES